MTGVYTITTSQSGGHIIVGKRINLNNEVGQTLYKRLRKRKHLQTFNKCITHSCKHPIIGKHAVPGRLTKGRGNYCSPLVQGPTLGNKQRIQQLDHHNCVALIVACEELIHSLRQFKDQNGYLIGDWTPHNLVWNQDNGNLVNIDLEGFYTYSPWGPDLSWESDESNLQASIIRIRQTVVTLRNQLITLTTRLTHPTSMTLVSLPRNQLLVPFTLKSNLPSVKKKATIIKLLPISFSTQHSETIDIYLWKGGPRQGAPRFFLTTLPPDSNIRQSYHYFFSFPSIIVDKNYGNFPKLSYTYKNSPYRTHLSVYPHYDKTTKHRQTNHSFLIKGVIPCHKMYSLLGINTL